MKRTVVAVLLGLVVLSGCGRAQEAPTVVLPQEAPVVASVVASPVPSSSPSPSPSVKPARVVVEDEPTTAPAPKRTTAPVVEVEEPEEPAVAAGCPTINMQDGQTIAEPATYSTPKRTVWTCSNGVATSKQEANPAYDPARVAKDAATPKGPLGQ